jgi:hypothetical protein
MVMAAVAVADQATEVYAERCCYDGGRPLVGGSLRFKVGAVEMVIAGYGGGVVG